MQGNNRYGWCQMMLYQTPNLISKYSNVVQMTSDTSVAVTGWEAKNLLQNLENRVSGYDNYAIISWSSLARLTQHTCFKSDYQQIYLAEGKFIMGFDFTESVFIHAILHSQDFISAWRQYT